MDVTSALLNQSEETLHIALCVNDGWADYVGPILYGLNHHHPHRQVQVHLVYRQVSQDKLTNLLALSDLLEHVDLNLCHVAEGLIDQISVEGYHLPLETYFRLLLPDILPSIERVIYLDVDVLVAGQLDGLWQLDLQESCIAAAQDMDVHTILSWHLDRIGYGPDETYFNAGILLLDLAKMRQRDLTATLINKAQEWADKLFYGDQDLLNFYFKDEVVYCSGAYNFQAARMRTYQEGDHVALVHFNGPQKPWLNLLDLEPVPRKFAGIYQAYQRQIADLLSPGQKRVTVFLDATRGSTFLSQALSSSCGQRHHHLEVVVACNQEDQVAQELVKGLMGHDERVNLLIGRTWSEEQLLLEVLAQATGDFLAIVDANDYLEPGFVADLLALAEKEEADLTVSAYYGLNMETGTFYFPLANELTSQLVRAQEALAQLNQPVFGRLAGKLYRHDFLTQVLSWSTGGGLDLLAQLYLSSQKTVYLKGTYFCHRTHLPLGEMAEQLSYWLQNIKTSQACLNYLILAGAPNQWLREQLESDVTRALDLCDSNQSVLAHYLHETLTLLSKN